MYGNVLPPSGLSKRWQARRRQWESGKIFIFDNIDAIWKVGIIDVMKFSPSPALEDPIQVIPICCTLRLNLTNSTKFRAFSVAKEVAAIYIHKHKD
jgi:hypothetical protein